MSIHGRARRRFRVTAAGAGLLLAVTALAGCGGAQVSSNPTQAASDLFAAVQANDCDRVYALQTKALNTQAGGKTCVCTTAAQLAERYRGNAFRVDRVDAHGDRADVYCTRTNADGTTRTAMLGVVVEDGTWKVNSAK